MDIKVYERRNDILFWEWIENLESKIHNITYSTFLFPSPKADFASMYAVLMQ